MKLNRHLISKTWDSVFILNGYWLFLIALIFMPFVSSNDFYEYGALCAALLFSAGHLISPILTISFDSALRKSLFTERKIYILYALIALTIPSYAILLSYQLGGLELCKQTFLCLGVALLIWDTWHFSAQHFGVLSIYRILSKDFNLKSRITDRIYTVFMVCILLPLSWYANAYDVGLLQTYLPTLEKPIFLKSLIYLLAVLSLVFILIYENKKLLPHKTKILYEVFIFIQVVTSVFLPLHFVFILYMTSHWIIEISLISLIQKENLKSPHSSFKWVFLSFVFFSILFQVTIGIPDLILNTIGLNVSSKDLSFVESASSLWGLVPGLFLSVFFLHYISDRFLFSFKDPVIKKVIYTKLFKGK